MDDPRQMGRLAGQVLENDAFRFVCGAIQDDMRKAFLGDDDDAAMEARRQVKALEGILTKLSRLQERGRVIEKQDREKAQKKEEAEKVAP